MTTDSCLVALDLDDTLFLEGEYVESGFKAVDAYLRHSQGMAGFLEVAMSLFRAGRRGDVFNGALAELGWESQPNLVEKLIDVYRVHLPTISLLPDVASFLSWARAHYVVGVLTDGYAISQRRKVEALAISTLVDHIVLCDELGRECWKPSTAPFERLSALSGCPPAHSVYIGDNPGKDVLGATSAGWRSILIRRAQGEHAHKPIGKPAPHAVVSDLVEARETLRAWGAASHA